MTIERYWVIYHDADLTETGSPQRRTYLKTVWEGFPSHQCLEEMIVRDWCRERFGPEVAYVQGIAATQNWIVCESNVTEFELAIPTVWGGSATTTRRIVLGIGNRCAVHIHSDVDSKSPNTAQPQPLCPNCGTGTPDPLTWRRAKAWRWQKKRAPWCVAIAPHWKRCARRLRPRHWNAAA